VLFCSASAFVSCDSVKCNVVPACSRLVGALFFCLGTRCCCLCIWLGTREVASVCWVFFRERRPDVISWFLLGRCVPLIVPDWCVFVFGVSPLSSWDWSEDEARFGGGRVCFLYFMTLCFRLPLLAVLRVFSGLAGVRGVLVCRGYVYSFCLLGARGCDLLWSLPLGFIWVDSWFCVGGLRWCSRCSYLGRCFR